MNCDKHLFKKPPSDLYPSLDYWVQPPKADLSDISVERQPVKMSERQAKREQFMLCQMVDAMNEALRYHKKRACKDGNASFSELYTIHDDPSNY